MPISSSGSKRGSGVPAPLTPIQTSKKDGHRATLQVLRVIGPPVGQISRSATDIRLSLWELQYLHFSDYQGADDSNYEAIPTRTGSQLSRKYEIPDELPPIPGVGGSTENSKDVHPAQLPPKKKPMHFIRDPNFLAQVNDGCKIHQDKRRLF